MLPRWRGAAPIHRAIEAGDRETGVTIMQMDAGLDTGDMLLVERLPIAPGDSTGILHDKLSALGSELIVRSLALAERGELRATPQPEQGVSYAHKIDKAEAQIDWSQPAEVIARRIRALNPRPARKPCWTASTAPKCSSCGRHAPRLNHARPMHPARNPRRVPAS